MIVLDFAVDFGYFLLAGIILGVPVIIALLIHVWWNKRKQRRGSSVIVAPAPIHPYRTKASKTAQRIIKAYPSDAWVCFVCGAAADEGCDPGLHS